MQPLLARPPPTAEPDGDRYRRLAADYNSLKLPDSIYGALAEFYQELASISNLPPTASFRARPINLTSLPCRKNLHRLITRIDELGRNQQNEDIRALARTNAIEEIARIHEILTAAWRDFGKVTASLTASIDNKSVHDSLALQGFRFVQYPSSAELSDYTAKLRIKAQGSTIHIKNLPPDLFSHRLLIWLINTVADEILAVKGHISPGRQSGYATGSVQLIHSDMTDRAIALCDCLCVPLQNGAWIPDVRSVPLENRQARLDLLRSRLAQHFGTCESDRLGLVTSPMSVEKQPN